MTDGILKQAVENREERENLLNKYNMATRAINDLNKKGFVCRAIVQFPGTGRYEDIYPSVKEFRLMLLNVRDRLDAEIARLDKEFASL